MFKAPIAIEGKLKALRMIGNSALVDSIFSFIAVAFRNIYYKRDTHPGLIC
nr:MAG TPA: hypothetical protein [Caudoviricetes sp.]